MRLQRSVVSCGSTVRVDREPCLRPGTVGSNGVEERWETTAELLAVAEKVGCSLTPGLLARWHRAGVLPTPKQRSLGRGRGSVSCYPPGSRDQLVVLLSLRPRRRRLDELAWAMWWNRSGIPTVRARPYAVRTFESMNSVLAGLIAEDGAFSEEVERFLDGADRARLEPRALGWVRNRLGVDDFDRLLDGVLRQVSGSTDAAPSEQTAALIERGFGLDRARDGPGPDGAGWLEGSLIEALGAAAELLNPRRLGAVLAASSDAELERARDEVQQFTAALVLVGRLVEAMGDRWAYGFGPLGALLDETVNTSAGQVQLVGVWRSLEQAGHREGMDTVLDAASKVSVPPGAVAFFKALRRRLPEARPALAEAVRSLADPAHRGAVEDKIRHLRDRHAAEIDALAAEIGLAANGGPVSRSDE